MSKRLLLILTGGLVLCLMSCAAGPALRGNGSERDETTDGSTEFCPSTDTRKESEAPKGTETAYIGSDESKVTDAITETKGPVVTAAVFESTRPGEPAETTVREESVGVSETEAPEKDIDPVWPMHPPYTTETEAVVLGPTLPEQNTETQTPETDAVVPSSGDMVPEPDRETGFGTFVPMG